MTYKHFMAGAATAAALLGMPAMPLRAQEGGPQQSGTVVTVNGTPVEHALAQLTFDGDNVVLHFADGAADMTADMAGVSITLAAATRIDRPEVYTATRLVADELRLGGLAPGERVALYDAAGRLLRQTTAAPTATTLPLAGLRAGTYIVRAGQTIIKFRKP